MAAGVTWIQRRNARRAIGLTILGGALVSFVPTSGPGAAVALAPVIVRVADGELSDARSLIEGLGGDIEYEASIINGFIGELPSDRLDDLALHDEILSVTPNAAVQLASSDYDPSTDPSSTFHAGNAINARQLWEKGFTGAGIGVAVIDTGVSPVKGLDGSGKVIYGPDFTPEATDPALANLDGYGHGTFMAGLIGGNDSTAPSKDNGKNHLDYIGIAPDVRIISLKVGDREGNTVVGSVIMALDWVVQRAADPDKNIRVVNLSFSTNSSQTYTLDPLAFAAERAWFKGIVVVTSAGNAGDSTGRMTMPAVDPYVLAVGAAHTMGTHGVGDDEIPLFSSRGDGIRNPDVVAPGVSVQGLRVPGSYADQNFGTTAAFADRFIRGSGTSQAAAITSGAVALLLSQRPYLRPDQIKTMLTSSAKRLPNADAQAQGAGLVDVRAASSTKEAKRAQRHWRSSGLGSIRASGGTWVETSWSGNTWSGNNDSDDDDSDDNDSDDDDSDDNDSDDNDSDDNDSDDNDSDDNDSGNTWSGNTWSGNTWSGNTWSGNTWSGNTWSGNTWSGNTWSGNTWSGNTWSTGSWG